MEARPTGGSGEAGVILSLHDELFTKCCVCGSLFVAGLWLPGILGISARFSHGYCPACLAEAIKDADTYVHSEDADPDPAPHNDGAHGAHRYLRRFLARKRRAS